MLIWIWQNVFSIFHFLFHVLHLLLFHLFSFLLSFIFIFSFFFLSFVSEFNLSPPFSSSVRSSFRYWSLPSLPLSHVLFSLVDGGVPFPAPAGGSSSSSSGGHLGWGHSDCGGWLHADTTRSVFFFFYNHPSVKTWVLENHMKKHTLRCVLD